MRRIYLPLFLFWLLLVQQAVAKPSEHLNFGTQLNAAECNTTGARLVINVIQHIIGDADSGEFGNYWAYDEVHRRIQVWQLSENPDTFCAVLKYMGSFVTVPGESPGFFDPDTNDTVAAGVTGTFEGGYRSTVFTGTLKDPPDYRTVGTSERLTICASSCLALWVGLLALVTGTGRPFTSRAQSDSTSRGGVGSTTPAITVHGSTRSMGIRATSTSV